MDGFSFRHLFGRKREPSVPNERRAKERVPPRPDETILIVDDSRTVVHFLRNLLQQDGYTTLTAGTGEDAVQIAQQQRPALILMDIIMPGLNGFQATRLLRKDPRTQHIPIILISGTEQPTEMVWGRRMGANDFLPKPIERGSLFPKIEALLRQPHVA